jgi:P-type Mg2+ transporter
LIFWGWFFTSNIGTLFGIVLPFSPFGAYFGMVPLPLPYFGWPAAILLSYCLLTQVVKTIYIRRFGHSCRVRQWL